MGSAIKRFIKFRAKISKAGDKMHLIIPKRYHEELKNRKMISPQFVDITIEEVEY